MKSRVIPNDELIGEIKKLVAEGSQVSFTPKGMSMLPFIRGNHDGVLLGKPSGLCVGDAVLAELEGPRYVLHRIERFEGEKVILMGDGNIVGREVCREEDVIAIALKVIKDGKEIDCRSMSYMRKVKVWRWLLPIRRYLLAIYKRIVL